METLLTLSKFLLLGLLIAFPFPLLKALRLRVGNKAYLLSYILLSLLFLGILMFLIAWWADQSQMILLSHYGFDHDAMSDVERFRHVAQENMERVKSLQRRSLGIGWPLKAMFGFVIFIPYLFIVYFVSLLINRIKNKE
ncbi:hypothetical protein EO244_13420 [Ancylomarina salipaludis]|uniref:Uncharacterized protein n=1 Tax=Ancylomarina salipaludis TaxID=2501299 RepID=A0A4Q1JKD7_9BACT|nr:hypothetical protein [Ancylomarina salipaludis]RXQ90404.1 hypothetical protein EO244_13420 [Ancylomarina salipaludis]